jgi:hypothetical protein
MIRSKWFLRYEKSSETQPIWKLVNHLDLKHIESFYIGIHIKYGGIFDLKKEVIITIRDANGKELGAIPLTFRYGPHTLKSNYAIFYVNDVGDSSKRVLYAKDYDLKELKI